MIKEFFKKHGITFVVQTRHRDIFSCLLKRNDKEISITYLNVSAPIEEQILSGINFEDIKPLRHYRKDFGYMYLTDRQLQVTLDRAQKEVEQSRYLFGDIKSEIEEFKNNYFKN